MALPFERVNTRKLALAAKCGYKPHEVAEDGITDEYIEVLIDAYDGERAPSNLVAYEDQSATVKVYWDTPEQQQEAREARDGDWAETLAQHGITPEQPSRLTTNC